MELENLFYNSKKIKRKLAYQLVEKLNSKENIENTEKKFQQKTIKNDYLKNKKEILWNILKNKKNKNNKNKNLIKELKAKKYFTQLIKKKNLLIYFFVFINSFILIFANEFYEMKKFSFFNEITIKISGSDIQNILNENYIYKPDEIYIESISYSIDEQNRIINLTKDENIITMKWNNALTNCSYMFYGLSNIKEIDLTYTIF